jgi:hypothetical protein
VFFFVTDSEDEACVFDDGCCVVVRLRWFLPGGSNAEDAVWSRHDPVPARLEVAVCPCSVSSGDAGHMPLRSAGFPIALECSFSLTFDELHSSFEKLLQARVRDSASICHSKRFTHALACWIHAWSSQKCATLCPNSRAVSAAARQGCTSRDLLSSLWHCCYLTP